MGGATKYPIKAVNNLNPTNEIILMSSFGFIIVRHVCNKTSDMYWKESYRGIRKWYPETPIMIIDDSSNREFLKEDITLSRCTVIYDWEHKGCAELLPYYYFHLLRPFEIAIILNDSVFIQQKIDFTLEEGEPCRFLWDFHHLFDDEIMSNIQTLCLTLHNPERFASLYRHKDSWQGCFGTMSVIRWDFLHKINRAEGGLFDALFPAIKTRYDRCALERVFALLITVYYPKIRPSIFGKIHEYIRYGTSFSEYLTGDFSAYPIIKVWTGR